MENILEDAKMHVFTFQLTLDTINKLNSSQNTICNSPVQTFHWSLQIFHLIKFIGNKVFLVFVLCIKFTVNALSVFAIKLHHLKHWFWK